MRYLICLHDVVLAVRGETDGGAEVLLIQNLHRRRIQHSDRRGGCGPVEHRQNQQPHILLTGVGVVQERRLGREAVGLVVVLLRVFADVVFDDSHRAVHVDVVVPLHRPVDAVGLACVCDVCDVCDV